MLLRFIFLILIFIYHKQIYDFLNKNNLTSIKGIQNKIKKVEKVRCFLRPKHHQIGLNKLF